MESRRELAIRVEKENNLANNDLQIFSPPKYTSKEQLAKFPHTEY